MSEEKALVRSEDFDVRGTALEVYGSRESIREMVERLMSFHPAAAEVGSRGMLGAAHLAHLVGASPLPSVNEIHIWKDDKGRICVTLGVNYYRRRANELGGVYWVDEPRLMTEQERAERAIQGNDYAALARAARRDDVDQFVARMMELARGSAFKDVFGAGLEMHTRTGVGTCRRDSYAKKNRPPAWTALKGAEIDLFRQLFPNLEQKPEPGQMARIIEEIPKSGVDDDTLTMAEIEELARMRDRAEALDAELDELSPEELQERGERAGEILHGRRDDDDLCPPEGCAGAFKEDDLDAILDEALENLNLDDVEEIPFGEDEPVVPDEGPESAIADRQDPAAEEEPEPVREPEREPVDCETIRLKVREASGWVKDGSRPNKLRLNTAEPLTKAQQDAVNGSARKALRHDREVDTKTVDEERRACFLYLYGVSSSNSLSKQEASAFIDQFCVSENGKVVGIRAGAVGELRAIVAAHRAESGQQELPGI